VRHSKSALARAKGLRRRIDALRAMVAPRVPQVDPHDLDLILWNVLRPANRRDWLVRRPRDGRQP
jgi:hypothetical protein